MSNNAANTEVKTITPITPLVNESKDVLKQTTVTFVENKEQAFVISADTAKYLDLMLKVQDDTDNATLTGRANVETAVFNLLKAQCNVTIQRWANFVSKVARSPKYKNSGKDYAAIENILKDNPKFKMLYNSAVEASRIKATL